MILDLQQSIVIHRYLYFAFALQFSSALLESNFNCKKSFRLSNTTAAHPFDALSRHVILEEIEAIVVEFVALRYSFAFEDRRCMYFRYLNSCKEMVCVNKKLLVCLSID